MTSWTVEVTRTVRVEVDAASFTEARSKALAIGWEWVPEQAGGDQGEARVRVVRWGGATPVAETEGSP